VLLVIATPLLLVAALWMSTNRRATVVQLSIGSALLLIVVRRVVLRSQDAIVAMPPQPAGRTAAQVVTDQLSAGLFELTTVLIVVGLVVAAIALVTGPYRWAVALRSGVSSMSRALWDAGARVAAGADTVGATAWVATHRQALQIGGALLVIGILLLVDVSWVWLWILLALLACWELALWRLPPDGASRPPPTSTPAAAGHDG
jgi:vacuolar-type H+-ATPase subunit I/STV1